VVGFCPAMSRALLCLAQLLEDEVVAGEPKKVFDVAASVSSLEGRIAA